MKRILLFFWGCALLSAPAFAERLRPLDLSSTRDGSLVLTYSQGDRVEQVTSADGGATWSKPIPAETPAAAAIRLRSGMLLRPVQGTGAVSMEVSMDQGGHWMPFGVPVPLVEKVDDGRNFPELVPLRDGRIALLTSAHGYNWRYKSVSSDFGQTWSVPQPFFCNPWTASTVTVLPSGKWLLVKNGKIDENLFYVPRKLYAYLSDDEGTTWYGGMMLDDRVDAVDPVVCAPGNGSIYIAYAFAPEDGHSAEIRLVTTGEAEIGMSEITAATKASNAKIVVDGNKEAKAAYDTWLKGVTSSKGTWASQPIRVASYNIEYKHPDPSRPAWEDRLPYIDWVVREYGFDVMGVQEPFEPEFHDLERLLGDEYDAVFASTNLEAPDFSNAIFWKRSRVERLDGGVIWFTENPGAKGGFGGSTSRLCIWAKFRDRETGMIFFHFNSHYDFISPEAMLVSSRLLVDQVREIAGEYPSFLTGDFNCSDGHPALLWIEESGFLADTKKRAAKAENAEYSSMRRYAPEVAKNAYQLDHIYFTTGKSKVKTWKLVMDEHDGMRGGSDHMPIYIDWILSN
ncbi:MAG: exo-alpha-sialidase [Bacteroidales bacterium]|nr:exo-alpha-sialidase [Bacteroidales bacterium]